MARKANKNIKFTQVKKESKLVHHKEVYEFENGDTVTYNPIFAQSEIQELLENLQKTMLTVPEGVEIDDKLMQRLTMYHIVRQFTHFKPDLNADDFVTQLSHLEALLNLEIEGKSLFLFIVEELFNHEQIMKVFDKMSEVAGTSMYLNKFNEKAQEHFEKLDIKNKEVFKNLKLN